MDTQYPATSSSQKRTELHEGSTSGASAPKHPRTTYHTPGSHTLPNNPNEHEQNPPNTRIHEGMIQMGGRELKVKVIFTLHTEESFRDEVCDQGEAVVPMHRAFSPGSIPFKQLRELGRGRAGVVDEVEPAGGQFYLPGKVYARKTVTLGPRKQGGIAANELALLDKARSLYHRHLQRVVMTYEEEIGFHTLAYGIVMHPVAKFTLSSFHESLGSSPLSQETLVGYIEKWAGCLGSALSYVHAHDVLHRNIKPSGILVENEEVFLAEFAISNHHQDTHMLVENEPGPQATVVDIYVAPEVHMQQPFGPKADVFSLGCIYSEMLALVAGVPYESLKVLLDEERRLPHIQRLPRKQSFLAELDVSARLPSPPLQTLIKCCQSMISPAPDARPSAFLVTDTICKSMLQRESPGSDRKGNTELPCECCDPWKGDKKACCKVLLSVPQQGQESVRESRGPGRFLLPFSNLPDGDGKTCSQCSKSFEDFPDMLMHMVGSHPEMAPRDTNLSCIDRACAHLPPFPDEDQLQNHEKLVHGLGF